MTFISNIQAVISLALSVLCIVLAGWAMVDVIIRPAAAFVAERKLSKPIWLAISIVAFAVSLLSFGRGFGGFLSILGVGAAVSYLVWARPALKSYRRPRGQQPPRSGGW